MSVGRKPKPTIIRQLTGNPGHRPINMDEPQPENGAPACPDWLNEIARDEWYTITPELERLKLITKVDGAALASYCVAYSRLVEAEGCINRLGMLIEIPILDRHQELVGHKAVKNPACTQAFAAQKEMRACLALFGMNPSDRSRLKVGSGEKTLSPLAQLMKDRASRSKDAVPPVC